MRSTVSRTTDTQDKDLRLRSDSRATARCLCSIQNSQLTSLKRALRRKKAPRFECCCPTPQRSASHKKSRSSQTMSTLPVPRRLTHVVAPSPVRRTDASARSRWKRGSSVRVARGRSGPRPPAAPAGPRQTHASHAIAGGGGEVHPPAATPGP